MMTMRKERWTVAEWVIHSSLRSLLGEKEMKRNGSYSEKKIAKMMVRHEWTLEKCKRTFSEEDANFFTVLKKAQIDKLIHSSIN